MASEASHAHSDHGQPPDHHPHVTPLAVYLAVWGALVVLTVITVAVSRVDFGPANLFIALFVATVKATLVALFFMHLFWDNKFNSVILLTSVIFLGIFIAFTSFDTNERGWADMREAQRPADVSDPFNGGYRPTTVPHRKRMPHEGEHGAAAPAHGAAPEPGHAPAPAAH